MLLPNFLHLLLKPVFFFPPAFETVRSENNKIISKYQLSNSVYSSHWQPIYIGFTSVFLNSPIKCE